MPKTADQIALDLINRIDIAAIPTEETAKRARIEELVGNAYALADALIRVRTEREPYNPPTVESVGAAMREVYGSSKHD